MLLLEGKILLVESVDAVNHGLDELDLGVAETMLVGNVVGDAGLAAGFAAGSTGLEVEGLAALLQRSESFLGPSGKVDVNGGSHSGAEVGRAGVEESETRVEHEVTAGFLLDRISDGLDTSDKSVKDTADISTWS